MIYSFVSLWVRARGTSCGFNETVFNLARLSSLSASFSNMIRLLCRKKFKACRCRVPSSLFSLSVSRTRRGDYKRSVLPTKQRSCTYNGTTLYFLVWLFLFIDFQSRTYDFVLSSPVWLIWELDAFCLFCEHHVFLNSSTFSLNHPVYTAHNEQYFGFKEQWWQ